MELPTWSYKVVEGNPIDLSFNVSNSKPGSRVTTARLHPVLNKLLEAKTSSVDLSTYETKELKPPSQFAEALREHIFNNMPLRLILLPDMELVGRDEVFRYITAKMGPIFDEELLFKMMEQIYLLGHQHVSDLNFPDMEEEDAREDPRKAIFQFLILKFARYAILSHTWLSTGEILYQHTLKKDRSSLEGPGFDKLNGFCRVAYRDHDITLAWIDTLCINKDSSVELDESIQSMYKWYQNSSICITYLGDTLSLDSMESDTWFKRGWTLQELLAPKIMKFYGREWTHLTFGEVRGNDKVNDEVQDIIYKVTGIPAKELVSFDPLTGSDVPTRMRWAASRKTTRGEDRAYSLMGIFGVNFSISYGEGAERAFFRLIEVLISSRHTFHIMQVLHWAKKAVSVKIHTSRLIPSEPECYNDPKFQVSEEQTSGTQTGPSLFPTLAEPMILTHLGLRVRLLLSYIPRNTIEIRGLVPIQDTNLRNGPFNIRLRVSENNCIKPFQTVLERRLPRIPAPAQLLDFYNNSKDVRTSHGSGSDLLSGQSSFFLGIYTFEENDYTNCVYLPLVAHAFLLVIPKPRNEFTVRDVTSKHFGPNSKIDTREVIKLSLQSVSEFTDRLGPESESSLRQRTVKRVGRFFKTPEIYGPHEIDGQQEIDGPQGCITIKGQLLEAMGMKVINVYL
ncbi:heterokaryon incompatibility protein-domain-containing protein [Pholiota molesta]|nr:heterokaryon incompatibility protein-domain-containing protein [Pholiota molesta]